jgi:hypothetical protein
MEVFPLGHPFIRLPIAEATCIEGSRRAETLAKAQSEITSYRELFSGPSYTGDWNLIGYLAERTKHSTGAPRWSR